MSSLPAAFAAADWCLRLHDWPIMPPLLGVYDFTVGLPPSPPTGIYVFTDRFAVAAADWCLRLHGWPIIPPLLGVYDFTAGLPLPPLTGVFAYTLPLGRFLAPGGSLDGPSNARIQIQICTKGIHGFNLISYAPGMDQSEHHHRLAFAAADWCLRLHGWPIMPLLLGVYVFTDRPPRPPPTGVSACTAGLLCRRCWASTSSPTGLPSPPPTSVSAYTVGWLYHRCWASTSSPTGRLIHRRLVFPPARLASYATVVGHLRLHRPACLRRCRLVSSPARLAYYAAVVGRLRLHRPAASSTADWCFRLHGWPLMPPLLGVYVFTDRLAFASADWCLRLHGWPIMPPLLGVYVFTDRLAFATADWCLRLYGWMVIPPLLGVYVFTDRPPHPPPTGVFACTAGLLCHRCWASTSSPTGRLVRRRLVFLPARLASYATVVGRLRLH
uniref:cysteine dioxygenase n=1 Tax=Oryza rufipogon TaxID=4529 RepID=A0A679BEE7_ORYRU|nr:HGWP repeat containing protein-like [Oryza rufipogon]BBF90183.1 HGWP repeat containing protein-like [Oryza rufipogon]